jgi:uncharacterized RDD family membrane protein YckC
MIAEVDLQYAGPGWRFLAFLIDAIVLAICGSILGIVVGNGLNPLFMDYRGQGLLGFVLQWLYFAGLESSSMRGTLGKRACGLIVVDMEGRRLTFLRATARYFSKILSALVLLVGYLMIAFTERRQGLHDLIASTVVLREMRLMAGAPSPPAPPDTH